MSDNDVIIAGFAGFPKEYAIIRTVILAKDSTLTLKEFRAQLLGLKMRLNGRLILYLKAYLFYMYKGLV